MQTVTWKQAQKKQRIYPIGAQKALKTGSQNEPKSAKITKNPVLGPHVSFHGPLGCPQAGKMVLRVRKWRHQACQTIGFGHPK